jgi:hypothetical protein
MLADHDVLKLNLLCRLLNDNLLTRIQFDAFGGLTALTAL